LDQGEIKKRSFKLEDRGKPKEKISSGGELCITVEDITGTPAALAGAAGGGDDEGKKEKKKK